MKNKKESERKFLIKFPISWEVLSQLFDHLNDIKKISQTYLIAEKGKQAGRVRRTIQGLSNKEIVYHFNRKKPIETGVHQEEEKEITQQQYQKYLQKADPKKKTIEKTRFVFDYDNQTFELDVFKGDLKGLAILEIELKNIDDEIKLPPFLKIVKEVTKEKKYNNFELANK